MAKSERVTACRGDDGDSRAGCWLELDGKYLWGGFRRESIAQGLAKRLNAAFDKTKTSVDEQQHCGIHRVKRLTPGPCIRCDCGNDLHCSVCCMEAMREGAHEVEVAADGMRGLLKEREAELAHGWPGQARVLSDAIAAYDRAKE